MDRKPKCHNNQCSAICADSVRKHVSFIIYNCYYRISCVKKFYRFFGIQYLWHYESGLIIPFAYSIVKPVVPKPPVQGENDVLRTIRFLDTMNPPFFKHVEAENFSCIYFFFFETFRCESQMRARHTWSSKTQKSLKKRELEQSRVYCIIHIFNLQ